MSDWINKIVRVEKVEKHPNADRLEIATVMGDYPIIIKLGQYKVGDLVGYLSIDSIVPDTEEFYFLCPKKYEQYEENGEVKQRVVGMKYEVGSIPEKYRRLRAKKILNVYSMGMLIDCPIGMKEDDDLVDYLGLKKFEEEGEENIPNAKKLKGANAAPPPKNFVVPYYDLQSIRKYISCVENEKDIILAEKLNGSNFSAVFDGEQMYVKSRNYFKKHDPDDMWIDIAIRNSLEDKLKKYPMIVLFGEVINQVKNFRYTTNIVDGKLLTDIYFFDAYNAKESKFLDYDDFRAIIKDLDLKHAPVLYRGPWTNKENMYSYAEGQSVLNAKVVREGWVLSLGKERFEPRLNGRLKLKYISQGYTLSKA